MNAELIIDSFAGGGRSPKSHPKHGLSHTPEYRAWQTARLRCTDPENPAWADYGGRGITMCSRWLNDVRAFVADMGPKPSPAHEIDRIDNDRGYEPGNCRWVLRAVNCRNRRSNRVVEFRGELRSVADWCESLGLPTSAVIKRLDAGWTPAAALTKPVRAKRPNGSGRRARGGRQ